MKDPELIPVFPVVDKDDEIVGYVAGKENLHSSGVPHRCIHIFVEIYGGGFVLQRKGPNSENAGTLSSAVSGHVEGDETYLDAAVREMKEELGLDIDEVDLDVICKIPPCADTGNEFVVLFSYLMDPDTEDIRPDSKEISEIVRLPFKQLILSVDEHTDEYSPAFVLLLNKFLEVQGLKGEP
jgi:8-oxo-dGTP pyrophosphatase MutT (NUDIX family)